MNNTVTFSEVSQSTLKELFASLIVIITAILYFISEKQHVDEYRDIGILSKRRVYMLILFPSSIAIGFMAGALFLVISNKF